MSDEARTIATPEEAAWTLLWAAGEPPFGPDYQRKGDIDRFFQWRRTQARLLGLGG